MSQAHGQNLKPGKKVKSDSFYPMFMNGPIDNYKQMLKITALRKNRSLNNQEKKGYMQIQSENYASVIV